MTTLSLMPLVWTEARPSCSEVSYDHVIAETPFGRYLIIWKSWKEHDTYDIVERPGGDYLRVHTTLDLAKQACQEDWQARITQSLLLGQEKPMELACSSTLEPPHRDGSYTLTLEFEPAGAH